MLKINGVAVATPKTFEVIISDLDGESNRNTNGDLIRDRIAVKRKLNCFSYNSIHRIWISNLEKYIFNSFQ